MLLIIIPLHNFHHNKVTIKLPGFGTIVVWVLSSGTPESAMMSLFQLHIAWLGILYCIWGSGVRIVLIDCYVTRVGLTFSLNPLRRPETRDRRLGLTDLGSRLCKLQVLDLNPGVAKNL